MGADIHFFLERKTTSLNYDGPKDAQTERDIKISSLISDTIRERWVSVDVWINDEDDDEWYCDSIYSDRNYYLFAVLADVRNSNNIDPISEPKGIPDDASAGFLYKSEQWKNDAHSHSYFTLAELLDVDWSVYNENYLQTFFEVIEYMKQIDPNPGKVRCCFFFDN